MALKISAYLAPFNSCVNCVTLISLSFEKLSMNLNESWIFVGIEDGIVAPVYCCFVRLSSLDLCCFCFKWRDNVIMYSLMVCI